LLLQTACACDLLAALGKVTSWLADDDNLSLCFLCLCLLVFVVYFDSLKYFQNLFKVIKIKWSLSCHFHLFTTKHTKKYRNHPSLIHISESIVHSNIETFPILRYNNPCKIANFISTKQMLFYFFSPNLSTSGFERTTGHVNKAKRTQKQERKLIGKM
jgi:hypothetical protein